ncbi:unnamed protein product [Arctia plantaginis]|uniref:Uncharacterized protein n=1 Tax=Arctia plantaginis TaxID=874455 RepID=A0A8S1A4G5_ARCPL|nr:unnamed protein product [Arctia plantaginis]
MIRLNETSDITNLVLGLPVALGAAPDNGSVARRGPGSDDTNKYANAGIPDGFSWIFIFLIPMTRMKIKLFYLEIWVYLESDRCESRTNFKNS